MLFDLRSRRRRRVVKSVYVFLALLIGVGLIGFGVGTGGNFGGLFNAAGGGGGGGTAEVGLKKDLAAAQKTARRRPSAPGSWVAVGRAAFNLSQVPNDYYVTNVGYTKLGHQTLAVLESAWQRYLGVLPANPNTLFAEDVAFTMGPAPTGIQKWSIGESAQEIVAQATPTYTEYANLAFFAYMAKEKNRGDLAAAHAIAIAPKSALKQLKSQLAVYLTEAGYSSSSGATSSTGATGSTSSSTSSSSSSSTSTSSSTSSTTSSKTSS